MFKCNVCLKWTASGILFGFLFPVVAFSMKTIELGFDASLKYAGVDHLFWMICTAPIFLGFFAYLGGRQNQKTVTLNENLEHLVQKRTEELINSAKFATLGEASSGIAHEIMNPMTVIQLKTLELQRKLQRGQLDNFLVNKNLDVILKTIDNVIKIIKGVRSFANSNTELKIENYSFSQLMEDIHILTEYKIKKTGVHLELPKENQFQVKMHGVQIAQVPVNLISNSCDAIENQNEKWIKITTVKEGPDLKIKVIDSGPGIPMDVQAKMGIGHFTTKSPDKGTGLGLTISKTILEKHGGKLWIDNTNPNTCFVLDLPGSLAGHGSKGLAS